MTDWKEIRDDFRDRAERGRTMRRSVRYDGHIWDQWRNNGLGGKPDDLCHIAAKAGRWLVVSSPITASGATLAIPDDAARWWAYLIDDLEMAEPGEIGVVDTPDEQLIHHTTQEIVGAAEASWRAADRLAEADALNAKMAQDGADIAQLAERVKTMRIPALRVSPEQLVSLANRAKKVLQNAKVVYPFPELDSAGTCLYSDAVAWLESTKPKFFKDVILPEENEARNRLS